MNASTQIDGEKIAKAVVARSQALHTLLNEKRTVFSWQYLGLILLGGFWGWLVLKTGAYSSVFVAVAAGVGFVLACAAFIECVKLRRRLEALIVLVSGQDAL